MIKLENESRKMRILCLHHSHSCSGIRSLISVCQEPVQGTEKSGRGAGLQGNRLGQAGVSIWRCGQKMPLSTLTYEKVLLLEQWVLTLGRDPLGSVK